MIALLVIGRLGIAAAAGAVVFLVPTPAEGRTIFVRSRETAARWIERSHWLSLRFAWPSPGTGPLPIRPTARSIPRRHPEGFMLPSDTQHTFKPARQDGQSGTQDNHNQRYENGSKHWLILKERPGWA
jgi:hypothetical protein